MTIVITGAAGFIGSALAETLLARGDNVLGIDNLNDYYDPQIKRDRLARVQGSAGGNRFAFANCDFSDMAALKTAVGDRKIEAIVHLGAQAGVRYSLENPAAYIQSNLVGHANMLEIARHSEVGHLVYASSSSVYGGNDKLPFSVDDRVDHPLSLYAATKKADELMSETYAHLYRLPQTGLRFFTVYGPWGRPDMAMWIFTRKILAGDPIPVFNKGEMWRDFTFIDDIVAGVVAALDKPPADDGLVKAGGSSKPHAIYNIGNNRSEKLTRVIGLIEQACGRKAEIDYQPMQNGDVQRTYADIDAIRNDLGYEPTTGIDVGIPRFVDWYRDYHGS
ncbi:NAD-dependent epimerase/dehydratase family protein [Aurantiacibacter spongiae]|uniref:NAD-dependent epimerase/dehydratase family protein n=1 Tax=Aurantiacibacter spongiae TaxID=2488860 RepID=A0A3N5D7I3_9SPHN|nr:NAD-dependent epimerase/dehydratase family protein [Aurantiacibacter spongiae]RPF70498.1 NAD-dependent epimerase/dehydratase family protein [Aurantiacibacter spongiae]